MPASWSIRKGGIGPHLRGVVLLDALYGETGNFVQWIKKSPSVFFISAYTSSTRRQNHELARLLDEQNIPYSTEIGRNLWRGRVGVAGNEFRGQSPRFRDARLDRQSDRGYSGEVELKRTRPPRHRG